MGKHRVANSQLMITEHAIVRFLQRIKGVDIQEAIREMIPEEELETIELLRSLPVSPGAEACWFACGSHVILIQGGTVVTVLTRDMVDMPEGEWEDWTSKATLRPLPIAGTPFEAAVECEVRRRVNDEGWQRRQETEAMKNAKRQVDAVHQQYEAKVKKLENEIRERGERLERLRKDAVHEHRMEKSKAVKMLAVVRELLGEEKYAELEALVAASPHTLSTQ